jgi:hypothetical protein
VPTDQAILTERGMSSQWVALHGRFAHGTGRGTATLVASHPISAECPDWTKHHSKWWNHSRATG